jgi:cation transport ATPase
VAVLLLMGGMLEDFVAARATRSLQSLAKLLPDMVTVRRGGHDESVSLDEVQVGESILVRSGERLAIDGTVISGTDVAMETADVGLLSDDLSKLPHLIEVSRKAIGVIKQNLVFSVGVLAAAVMLTIPGILTPVTGALLHELSSIPVIANSVRLIAYGPKVD